MGFVVSVLTRLGLGLSLGAVLMGAQPALPSTLYAAHYRPGLMEQVARRRNMTLVDCMISSPWHPLNTWMRIESNVNGEIAYCRTTDVSAPRDRARHKRRQLIELDWQTAKRLCAISRVAERPPRACPVKIEVITEEIALAALAPPPIVDTVQLALPPLEQHPTEQPAPAQPAPEQSAPTEQPAPPQPTPKQPAPEQPAPEQSTPEQPAPSQQEG